MSIGIGFCRQDKASRRRFRAKFRQFSAKADLPARRNRGFSDEELN